MWDWLHGGFRAAGVGRSTDRDRAAPWIDAARTPAPLGPTLRSHAAQGLRKARESKEVPVVRDSPVRPCMGDLRRRRAQQSRRVAVAHGLLDLESLALFRTELRHFPDVSRTPWRAD